MLNSIKVGNFEKNTKILRSVSRFAYSKAQTRISHQQQHINTTLWGVEEREKPSEVVDGRTPSQAMRLKSNVDVRIQIDFQLEFSAFKDDGDATLNFYRPIHRHSEVKGHNIVATPSWRQKEFILFHRVAIGVGVGCKMRFPCERKKKKWKTSKRITKCEKRRGDDENRNTTPSEKKGLKSYKGDRSIANTRLLRSDLAFFWAPISHRSTAALLLLLSFGEKARKKN